MANLSLTMCKECVKQWNSAGKQMSNFLRDKFTEAIIRDMTTQEEDGMFFLLCFEESIHNFTGTMIGVLFDELRHEVLDNPNPLPHNDFVSEWR